MSRLVQPSCFVERGSEFVVRLCVAGVDLEGGPPMRDRPVPLSRSGRRARQVVVGDGEVAARLRGIGIGARNRLKVRDRLLYGSPWSVSLTLLSNAMKKATMSRQCPNCLAATRRRSRWTH